MSTDVLRKYLDIITESETLLENQILNDSIYKEFHSIATLLVERKLSNQEIQDLFAQVEASAAGAGNNRTLIGKGKDAAVNIATAVSNAFNGVADKISRSGPVSGFDVAVDKLMDKIKASAGGDGGPVMQSIYKYRMFAKKHPVMQGAVYAIMIALAGISGAGLGGAALIGAIRTADKLLQGNKASSSLWSGFVAGALAYGAGQLGQAMQGSTQQPGIQNFDRVNPEPSIPSTGGTGAATAAAGSSSGAGTIVTQAGQTLSQIAQQNGTSVQALMQANPGITNPDVLRAGTKLVIPTDLASTYAQGVGTAADTMQKIGTGQYADSAISRAAAARAGLREMAIRVEPMPWSVLLDYQTMSWNKLLNESIGKSVDDKVVYLSTAGIGHVFTVMEQYQLDFHQKLREYRRAGKQDTDKPKFKTAKKAAQPTAQPADVAAPSADAAPAGPGRENIPDYLRPSRPGAPLPADDQPGFFGKIGQGLRNLGHQFTTKITKEKLDMNWKVAGSPTDSAELYKFLQQQKIPAAVIDDVYGQLGLEIPPGVYGSFDEIPQDVNAFPQADGTWRDPGQPAAPSAASTATQAGDTVNADAAAAAPQLDLSSNDILAKLKAVWEPIIANQNNPIGNAQVRGYIKDMWMRTGGTAALGEGRKRAKPKK